MRLVFPVPCDTAEEDPCPNCLEMVELWIADHPAFDARVRERHVLRQERADRAQEAQQADTDYAEFQLRQQASLRGAAVATASNSDADDYL